MSLPYPVDTLIKGTPDQEEVRRRLDAPSTQQSEFDELFGSLARLRDTLASTAQYLDGVVDGKIVGDAAIGAAIGEALAAVPQLNAEALERLASSSMQDLLMSVYLSNLTQTHVQLADRIHALTLPM